jgi:hypothetical protein
LAAAREEPQEEKAMAEIVMPGSSGRRRITPHGTLRYP